VKHERFDELLKSLPDSGVGDEILAEVLARTSLRAPGDTSRWHIAQGNPSAHRLVDRKPIKQGTVSKAVKTLLEGGLLENGEYVLTNDVGRLVAPLRLGRGFVIAGVHVEQREWEPSAVTTALVGLDTTRELDILTAPVSDSWESAAALVFEQVHSLLEEARSKPGSEHLQLFGIGVAVGTPVHKGEIMPAPSVNTIDFASMIRAHFPADAAPAVVVENDINALGVLAMHQAKYSDPDTVVIGVFDEGIGAGLVMDGRLRRGGQGKAMEIGHLAVGYAPGEDPWREHNAAGGRFSTGGQDTPQLCQCGKPGHVDTLATPCRIRRQLGDRFEDAAAAQATDSSGVPSPAGAVFMRAGSVLGRAAAHVCNIVNPSRLIIYMPEWLAKAKPGTAAAAYLEAARSEIHNAFAYTDNPDCDYPTIEPFPDEPAKLEAQAAALCVLEAFIEHALHLDDCVQANNRPRSNAA
jgi:predicted NBD/HSP70 family sugar kinase